MFNRIRRILSAELNALKDKVKTGTGTVLDKIQELDIEAFIDQLWMPKSRQRQEQLSPQQRLGDFLSSLLVLSAAVIRADGRVDRHELAYVRTYLADHFGPEHIFDYMQILEQAIPQKFDERQVCQRVKAHTNYDERLVMLQFLFGIANADFNVSEKEIAFIRQLGQWLELEDRDFLSIKAMYHQEVDSPYKILEIKPSASDAEVKTAYRQMAMKYHPDKVAHLGEAGQKVAQDKFRKVQEAYELIRKERGMK